MSKFEYFMNFIYSIWSVIKSIFMVPAKYIKRFCGPIAKRYKKIWIKFTYNKYDEFVYKRGALMVCGTVVSFFLALIVVGILFDASYYMATKKTETIYLSHSEEIYPDDNVWGVKGCYTPGCDSTSALYFRIQPSTFHHLWNITDNGHVFFPDIIGASVPTGEKMCTVTSYGLRFRILMMFNIYPNILQVDCQDPIQ